MLKLSPLLILSFILFFLCKAAAQNTDITTTIKPALTKTDTAKKKKSTVKLGLIYNSNSVYLARTDSVAIPVYNIGVTYTLKSGIFFTGTVNYIPSRQFDKLDGGSLETGYNFEKENLSGGIAVAKYFASFNSTQLVSALDAEVAAELSYDLFDIITPSAHVDYIFGNGGSNDIIVTAGLGHEFTVEKPFAAHDKLSIEPGVHFVGGSQNFYTTYFIRKSNSASQRQNFHSKGKGNTTGTTTTQGAPATTNSSKFQGLADEFNIQFTYTIKKMAFEFNPAYAIATHKIDDDGTKTFYVPNTSVFYLQFAVSYTF